MSAGERESLAEAYPKEQARVRNAVAEARAAGVPEFTFYIAVGEDLLRRAEIAAMSGDVVQMLRLFAELREFKE